MLRAGINEINMDITILIPTYNRTELLKRTLDFFSEMSSPYAVWVLDGGTLESQAENKKLASQYSFPVRHVASTPNSHWGVRIKEAFEQVETPYSILCADDDILNVNALPEAKAFLEKNPDHS